MADGHHQAFVPYRQRVMLTSTRTPKKGTTVYNEHSGQRVHVAARWTSQKVGGKTCMVKTERCCPIH